MKKKLLLLFVLTMALISFKARAATYNFNFYNNEKEDGTKNILPSDRATDTQVIPLAPTAASSSAEVATQKVEEIKESLFSLGYFYYRYNNLPQQSKTGNAFKIGFGKREGIKVEIEGMEERGSLIYIQRSEYDYGYEQTSYLYDQESKFKLFGAGLNLKKEFNISKALAFELGIGGQYLKGKRDPETFNYDVTEYNYHGLIGFNLYYDKLSFNLSARLVKSQLTTRIDTHITVKDSGGGRAILAYEDKKMIHTAGMATIGLTYHF